MEKHTERTLILVKPDGVQRGLVGSIILRLESRGLKILGIKMLRLNSEMAEKHYGVHKDRPFFPNLVDFITSGPIVAVVLEGSNAVEIVRRTMGSTNPVEAEPGTIRGDLATDIGRNLIHGSDSSNTAVAEINFFFSEDELMDYQRTADHWINELQ